MSYDDITERTEIIAKSILAHLMRNPDSGDTLEGIVDWWLEYEKIRTVVNEVADALDSLVAKGKLNVITSASGRHIYKLRS